MVVLVLGSVFSRTWSCKRKTDVSVPCGVLGRSRIPLVLLVFCGVCGIWGCHAKRLVAMNAAVGQRGYYAFGIVAVCVSIVLMEEYFLCVVFMCV